MKKLLALIAVSGLAISAAQAQYNENAASMPEVMTIAQAKAQPDETRVRIKGTLEKKVGDEKYQLNDGSEMIMVEIDDEDWNGVKVEATDTVIITGEVDKGVMEATEIDVESIEVVK